MPNKPTDTRTRKPLRSGVSIQFQLIIGSGMILAMAYVIASISFVNLRNIQKIIQTTLQNANQIQELSTSIQNEFLQARQNEAEFIASWRSIGFDAAVQQHVKVNQEHIATANAHLTEMETVITNLNKEDMQPLADEVERMHTLLRDYETAFQAYVVTIQERSRPAGVEDNLHTLLKNLEAATSDIPDPQYLNLVLKIHANEQAFLATGRQEFIDNTRLRIDDLINLINRSDQAVINASGFSQEELTAMAESYLSTFTNLVALTQGAEINTTIFREVTADINTSTVRMADISNNGLVSAQAQLWQTVNNTSRAILVTGVLALLIATLAEVIGARRIILPLRKFNKAVQTIGEGNLSARVNVRAGRELDTLAVTFNKMAEQLQNTLAELEQRVAERTKDLERRSTQLQVASEVSRDATSIRQLDILLNRAVNLVRERFGYYHAGIFMVDTRAEFAVLHAATGEAGRKMLQAGHKLKIGETGIVGYVTGTGEPRIALDVGVDAVHFRNPLLPETRSEMALPLKVGQRIIGALDVQSQQPSAFDQNDVTVLQIMADQLAVAIENARLFQEVQDSLQELQALYGQYSREAWARLSESAGVLGYQYDMKGVHPIRSYARREEPSLETDAKVPAYSFPLEIRGQVIGTLDIWPETEGWTPDELEMLRSISERLSQAIESARLFDDVQSRADRERLIAEITSKVRSSTSVDIIMQTAIHELSKALQLSNGAIQLRGGNGETANEQSRA
jgi:GAF domain-containing protein